METIHEIWSYNHFTGTFPWNDDGINLIDQILNSNI